MKKIYRILLYLLLITSLVAGAFPAVLDRGIYIFLYTLLFIQSGLFVFYGTVFKKQKADVWLIVVAVLSVLGIVFRVDGEPLYALAFLCMMLSYYSFSPAEIDDDLLKKISFIVVVMLIPTVIFNGFLSSDLEGGQAFSGRLNPLMYLPYVLIALRTIPRKKYLLRAGLVLEMILIVVDLYWSGSRIAIVSMLFMLVVLFIFGWKKNYGSKRKKKALRFLLVFALLFQILYPSLYLGLFDDYSTELNDYSNNVTSKSFFSGRQNIWKNIYNIVEKDDANVAWGTGDVNYEALGRNPHNDFLGVYYCWGIIVAVATYIYIYRVGSKGIRHIDSVTDLIIFASFLSLIVCSSNETIMYAPHFFVFEKILMSHLLSKEEK